MNRCARPVVSLTTAMRNASRGTRMYAEGVPAENTKNAVRNAGTGSKKPKVYSKYNKKKEDDDLLPAKVEIKGHSLLRGARLRRSFLYVPAHKERFLEKALTSAADCIVFDLEDGVAPSERKQARENLKNLWKRLGTEGYRPGENRKAELCLRVNNEGWLGIKNWQKGPNKEVTAPSEELDQDLDLFAFPEVLKVPITVVVPKANTPYDLRHIREIIFNKQRKVIDRSRQIKRANVIPTIETAYAVLNLPLFSSHQKHFSALVFAAEDYCASMGIPRTKDRSNMLFARSSLVHIAKWTGTTPIDMVCQDFKNLDILKEECEEGVHLGFEGKQAIHPDQIETINKVFSPDPDEVEWARELLAAVEKNKADGAFEFDGKMVDRPVFRKAENILEKHKLIEAFEKDRFASAS
ncbi:hypothetical protein TWF481_000602 [Arthrobotrys musiformis]|uniref:HpcH/HpaI aldolase/citrate lyase domain-containing protein n=1 Tax=Arthrobotrys musiformis TaxID=47236 RepID=A0AAV9WTU1_9PEZI